MSGNWDIHHSLDLIRSPWGGQPWVGTETFTTPQTWSDRRVVDSHEWELRHSPLPRSDQIAMRWTAMSGNWDIHHPPDLIRSPRHGQPWVGTETSTTPQTWSDRRVIDSHEWELRHPPLPRPDQIAASWTAMSGNWDIHHPPDLIRSPRHGQPWVGTETSTTPQNWSDRRVVDSHEWELRHSPPPPPHPPRPDQIAASSTATSGNWDIHHPPDLIRSARRRQPRVGTETSTTPQTWSDRRVVDSHEWNWDIHHSPDLIRSPRRGQPWVGTETFTTPQTWSDRRVVDSHEWELRHSPLPPPPDLIRSPWGGQPWVGTETFTTPQTWSDRRHHRPTRHPAGPLPPFKADY